MKRINSFFIVIVVAGCLLVKARDDEAKVSIGYAAITETVNYGKNRLYAHYTFDNGGIDAMGNADLNLVDAVTSLDHFKGNVAILNDMDSAYMEASAPLLFDTLKAMTFCAWIYLEAGNENGDDWEPIYEFWNDVSTQHEYLSPNLWGSDFGLVSSSPGWTNISSQPPLSNDTWQHVALTREGNMATVYLNGEVFISGDVGKTIGELEANEFYFGGNPDPSREYKYVNGMYDDVMIFHQALTAAQVLELARVNPPIPDIDKPANFEGATAWYPLDADGTDAIGDFDMALFDASFTRNYGGRGDVAFFSETDTTYGLVEGTLPVSGEKFTFAGWVYWDSEYAVTWQTFLEFYSTEDGDHLYLSPKIDWGEEYGIVMQSVGGWENMGTQIPFPKDRWAHVAFSFNNGTIILYLDGEKVGEHTFGSTWSDLDPDQFYLGPNMQEDRFYVSTRGMYDDVAFYDQVLTSFQIEALAEDRTASRPDVDNFVMEAEDYAFGNWATGQDGELGYASWSGEPGSAKENEDGTLLYGVYTGEGAFHVWGHVMLGEQVDTAFYLAEDEAGWSPSASMEAGTGWKWVKLYQTSVLSGGEHSLRIAPAVPGIQLDKLVITADFGFDPATEYVKSDLEQPTAPGDPAVSHISEKTALLVWDAASDNVGVSAYDIMEGDRVVLVTKNPVIRPDLLASTNYDFAVRAKDIEGNVSVKSSSVSFSTSDLTFSIDYEDRRQTIHHIGASDGWWAHWVANWPEAKREEIAKVLFSDAMDASGSPEGIALSGWRYQIGAGSLDMDNSGINPHNWFREISSYLKEDGTYDWEAQSGPEYWLDKAHEYGVEHFTAWCNSPPYHMTVNGYTFRTAEVPSYNLDAGKYADYADYLATIASHFQDAGKSFDAVSPINEPQWSWMAEVGSASQAGSYASNSEIAGVVRAMNTAFNTRGVDARILITEAGDIRFLHSYDESRAEVSDQVDAFWDPASADYIGDQPSLASWVAGHSYFSSSDVTASVKARRELRDKLAEQDAGLEYWQSEYCLLGSEHEEGRDPGTMSSIDYGLWLARLIYFDLVEGDATGWDFWTALSIPGAATHEERFGLLNWYPDPYDASHTDGTYDVAKLCWALGNYSRFVRPGYQRLATGRSDGLNSIGAADNQLFSAYLSPDKSRLVIVAINYEDRIQNLSFTLENFPGSVLPDSYEVYTTSQGHDLQASQADAASAFSIPAKSIVTLVAELEGGTGIGETENNTESRAAFEVFPNPASDMANLRFHGEVPVAVVVLDMTGHRMARYEVNSSSLTIPTSQMEQGSYILSVDYGRWTETGKLVVIR